MSSIIPDNSLIPHEEFNFEDGDIYFRCETSVFKLHTDFLNVHLPKLLTVKPSPPTVRWAECPLISLPDNPAIFASLLRMAYSGFTDTLLNSNLSAKSELPRMIALCESAGRYASESLRFAVFRRLWVYFPSHSIGKRDSDLDFGALQAFVNLASKYKHKELFARACWEIAVKKMDNTGSLDHDIRRRIRAGHKALFRAFSDCLCIVPPLPSCLPIIATSYQHSKGLPRRSARIHTWDNQCWMTMNHVFKRLQAKSTLTRGGRFLNPIKGLAEESTLCYAEHKLCQDCMINLATYLTGQAVDLECYLWRYFKI